MRRPKFPCVIEGPAGIASIKIRCYKRGKYTRYRFAHHAEGRRLVVDRASFESAKALAEQLQIRLANHQVAANSLTNEDVFAYRRLLQETTGFDVTPDQVGAQWARWRRLAGPEDIEVMIRFYLKHHQGLQARTFAQVYDELIAAKESAHTKGHLSAWYVSSLKTRCGKFKKKFSDSPITDLSADAVRLFLSQEEKLCLKSKSNLLEALNTLCRFAKARRYLPRDFEEFRKEDFLDAKLKGAPKIQIYRPGELADLLNQAELEDRGHSLTHFLAIGAFAGLRTAEFLRLDWEDLKFSAESAYIHVSAAKAKTQSRRLVPIQSNLQAWLPADARQRSGPIWGTRDQRLSQAYLHERIQALCQAAGTKWKPNALRHSFISYRAAQVQNVEKVAEEAGNSPKVIFSNYRELVTPEDAKQWFSIFPVGAQKLLALDQEKKAS